jgi:hypothetical protein
MKKTKILIEIENIIKTKNFSNKNIKKIQDHLRTKMKQYFAKFSSYPYFFESIEDGVTDAVIRILNNEYDETRANIYTFCFVITKSYLLNYSNQNHNKRHKYFEKIKGDFKIDVEYSFINESPIYLNEFIKKYNLNLSKEEFEILKLLLKKPKERNLTNKLEFHFKRIALIRKLKKQVMKLSEDKIDQFKVDLKNLIYET